MQVGTSTRRTPVVIKVSCLHKPRTEVNRIACTVTKRPLNTARQMPDHVDLLVSYLVPFELRVAAARDIEIAFKPLITHVAPCKLTDICNGNAEGQTLVQAPLNADIHRITLPSMPKIRLGLAIPQFADKLALYRIVADFDIPLNLG